MASGWFWFFGLLWAYILLIFWLIRSGKMQDWGLSLAFGFVLMIRTQKGKGALEAISRPKRFWNLFGDVGIGVVLLVMAGFTFLMLLIIGPSLDPGSGVEPAPANQILVIPGVNPIVPLWYGLIGLIVTLVVHEGGHGVLARANNLKVKSLGLLYAIVPIGAFVEPDEDEIKEASLRKRLRVFSAGPMVNVVVGLLILIPMIAMAGAADPIEGAALQSVVQDGPADLADIGPGDVITAVNGTPVASATELGPALEGYAPGDQVLINLHGGETRLLNLTDRWSTLTDAQREDIAAFGPDAQAWCQALYGEAIQDWAACAEAAQNDPMVGVGLFSTNAWHDVLTQPLGRLDNFARLIYLPLGEVQGSPILSTYLPAFLETPFHEQTFWITFNVLFWIFWLNILVGTFNALPMLPLDGGHIFRDATQAVLRKIRPNMDSERRDQLVGRLAGFVSLGIFAIILISLIGPRIAYLWA
ncbi:MAG: site-2 protease family protein [Thermoplasmatota archaeon]